MQDNTGYIFHEEEIKKAMAAMTAEEKAHFKPMNIPPTAAQLLRSPPRIGRNEPCPCGSGRKFKKCCCTR